MNVVGPLAHPRCACACGVLQKALSDTISSYASVAPPAFMSSLFKKLVQRLLEATQVPPFSPIHSMSRETSLPTTEHVQRDVLRLLGDCVC